MKLSVLMPVYNEYSTVEEIIRRVLAVPLELEIVVVDNCSDDGTREILQAMIARGEAAEVDEAGVKADEGNIRVLSETLHSVRIAFQKENGGKGKSVRRALELARGEWVIVQDADLEYDPRDFLKLLDAAQRHEEKIQRFSRHKAREIAVFGTRLKLGTRARSTQQRGAFFYGRIGLSMAYRLIYGTPLSDVATCYKLMRLSTMRGLNLQSSGFDLDFEIAARLRRQGVRILEVPISYEPRGKGDGKKISAVRDGARALFTLLKYRALR